MMMVAAVAGSTRRKIRLNDDEANLFSALSTCPDLARRRGANAFTKPIRIKKIATQECPLATSRKIGRWKSEGEGLPGAQHGGIRPLA